MCLRALTGESCFAWRARVACVAARCDCVVARVGGQGLVVGRKALPAPRVSLCCPVDALLASRWCAVGIICAAIAGRGPTGVWLVFRSCPAASVVADLGPTGAPRVSRLGVYILHFSIFLVSSTRITQLCPVGFTRGFFHHHPTSSSCIVVTLRPSRRYLQLPAFVFGQRSCSMSMARALLLRCEENSRHAEARMVHLIMCVYTCCVGVMCIHSACLIFALYGAQHHALTLRFVDDVTNVLVVVLTVA